VFPTRLDVRVYLYFLRLGASSRWVLETNRWIHRWGSITIHSWTKTEKRGRHDEAYAQAMCTWSIKPNGKRRIRREHTHSSSLNRSRHRVVRKSFSTTESMRIDPSNMNIFLYDRHELQYVWMKTVVQLFRSVNSTTTTLVVFEQWWTEFSIGTD
jgi:hypothetical protein